MPLDRSAAGAYLVGKPVYRGVSMRGRTRSLRGLIPGAIAGGVLALGWVVLSIAFGSGSAQAAETAPPSPPGLLGALGNTLSAVQDSIVEAPATVQSTLSAVQTTVSEALPTPEALPTSAALPTSQALSAPVAEAVPEKTSGVEASPAPAELAPPAAPLIAPLVDTIVPVVQSVGQTARAAVDTVVTTTETVAPALSPVLAPVDTVLRLVPTTLDTVTAALPRIAVSLDGTVGAVSDTVRGATAFASAPAPMSADPVGGPAVPAVHGASDPVSSASRPLITFVSAQDGAQPALPDGVVTGALSAVTAPRAPAQHPSGSPSSEFGVPGTGSASGGSANDVRILGTISSMSAGDRLLTVRSGSAAGDDRLPASPVADHDSSPD